MTTVDVDCLWQHTTARMTAWARWTAADGYWISRIQALQDTNK